MGLLGEGSENSPHETPELPVHVRYAGEKSAPFTHPAQEAPRAWLVYKVRFQNGEVEHDVDLDRVLMRGRYPADFSSTRRGADAVAGENGAPGKWVDYSYGRPLAN